MDNVSFHIEILDSTLPVLGIENTYDGYTYKPSLYFRDYFHEKVIGPYLKNYSNGLWHGMNKEEIIYRLLQKGRCEFDSPYISSQGLRIAPELKVLAYCFWNMRIHYFSLVHILKLMTNDFEFKYFLKKLFGSNFNFIDIGCGPLTSALALGEFSENTFSIKTNINYHGIDLSNTMITQAKEFTTFKYFNETCKFYFNNSISECPILSPTSTIFNFSFFFFNISKDDVLILDLIEHINKYCIVNNELEIVIIYQNPPALCEAYEHFKSKLLFLELFFYGTNKINYANNLDSEGKETLVKYELLMNKRAAMGLGRYTSNSLITKT